jgi:hypothetical protein
MSYDELRDYLRRLEQQKQSGQDIRIEFEAVPIDEIKTATPGRSMGLQLADAGAGAFFNALERDRFGNTEARYVETMSPVLYRHNGSVSGYGCKVVPRDALAKLAGEASLNWLRRLK